MSLAPTPCPACGADSPRLLADRAAVRAEVESLWAFHLRRLKVGAPVEELRDRVVFTQRPPIELVECAACGTVYRDPAERAREIVDAYSGEEVDAEALAELRASQLPFYRGAAARLTRFGGGPGRGVELGSYVGAFLAAAAERGWRFLGADVNEGASAFARECGADVVTGTLDDVDAAGVDAVAIWNCFDQLPQPIEVLRRARELLRPGGTLVVRVPNGAFYSRVRRRLDGPMAPIAREILALDNLLAFPYRVGYTPASLRGLMEREGFGVVEMRGDALVPTAGEWTRRWAALEERGVKAVLKRLPAGLSPWFEVYATS